jgi:outer membrane protein assembly factor BamB
MMKELKVSPCAVSYCSPLLVGDLLYVVTGNGKELGKEDKPLPQPRAPSFVAIHKTTGKIVWQDSSPGANVMEGQWTSPAYAEIGGRGQVIFPGGDGWLYAFEPKDGKLLWKFDCNPKGSIFRTDSRGTRSYLMATPVVCGGKVYIGTGQNPENSPGPGHLWCIDPNGLGDVSPELVAAVPGKKPTTKLNPRSAAVWHYGGDAPPNDDRDYLFGRTMSTCAVHDGLVYIAEQEGYLHCLDARTGEHYWQYDLKAGCWASPLWADGKIYMPDGQGYVHILAHGKDLRVLKKIDMVKGIKAPVVVANGVIYVRTDTQLFAIGPQR